MDLFESKKLDSFRKKYFEHAKKHSLYKNVLETNGKIVFGRGSDNPKIVFIGEAPGKEENKQGKSFVGRSGKLLDKWINEIGLGEKDFCVINVVPVIPLNKEKGIRKPTDEEIDYFLPLTKKFLEKLGPSIIVLLGRSAASIFDPALKVGQVKNWNNFKIFFIYHPSYYLRNGGKGFEEALQKLKNFLTEQTSNIFKQEID